MADKSKTGTKKADKKEQAGDCKFYKSDKECVALLKMVCKEKACKFYKSIHTS